MSHRGEPDPRASLVASPRAAAARGGPGRAADGVRPLLGWTGLLLTVVSGADIVLTWVPTEFGNPEWEFGTVTASFNGLISVALGCALVLVGLRDRAGPRTLKAASLLLLAAALLVAAAAALYGLSVPVALGSVSDAPIRLGLQKAIAKTVFQSVAFPIAFLYMARVAWRWSVPAR